MTLKHQICEELSLHTLSSMRTSHPHRIKPLRRVSSAFRGRPMATAQQDNKTIVKSFIETLVNEKDYDRAEDLIHTDYRRHDPGTPGDHAGIDPWMESLKEIHDAFPDMQVTLGNVIAENDLVAFEGTMSGTHRGKFRDLDPTGESFEVTGHAMHRIEDGKVAETWASWDFLSLLEQVGAVDKPV